MEHINKVAWLYIQDKKLFAARTKGRIPFYTPGGKPEQGETMLETLVRECKEELTIDIIPESAQFYGKFEAQAHGKPEGVNVIMHCYMADFEGELTPSNEIEEFGWLTSKDINTSRTSPVDYVILADLYAKGLVD